MNDPVWLDQIEEVARFDPTRLEDLCVAKGETQAEIETIEALDRISRLLQELGKADGAMERVKLAGRLEALISAADKIGMATLSKVARDARHCLSVGDPVALAATLGRLDRIGERSIHAVFDLHDMTV